ncbi:MAG: type II secretion system protein [Planctomycetota bacterium]
MDRAAPASGRDRGFTLIELLVVIAIAAVMLGFLLPVLGSARTTATLVRCGTHQRQIGVALHAYAGDADGILPPEGGGGGAYVPSVFQRAGYDLRAFVGPYLTDLSVWGCPATDAAPLDDPGNVRSPANYGTYGYYAGRADPDFGLPAGVPDRLDTAHAASSLTLLQDTYREDGPGELLYNHGEGRADTSILATNPSYAGYLGSNGDGVNTLFFDGHVVWTDSDVLDVIGVVEGPTRTAYGVRAVP